VAPLILEGELVALVASIAHHSDVGGMLPGSESAACRSIYQEGIRIPPVRLVREGELEDDLLQMVLLNSRAPTDRMGDLQAQVAANRGGVERLAAVCRAHGAETVAAAMAGFLDYTGRRFRQAVRDRMNEGVFEAEDWLDQDEPGGPPVRIALRMEVRDGSLRFDFAGTGAQLATARNVPLSGLAATVYTVCKSMVDPGLPPNSGYYDAITVRAPGGTLVNPRSPAPVGARSLTCGVLGDVVATALGEAAPQSALACSGPHAQLVLSGTDGDGRFFVDYETYAGGMGARTTHDGLDGVRIHASGASNLPVEALEHAFPLRVERYQLREDSGGPGRFRGGMGVLRDYVMLRDAEVSLSGERQAVAARGIEGAGDGTLGAFQINGEPVPGTVAARSLRTGDVLTLLTPGGGGCGRPEARDPAALARDLEQGRVSSEQAADAYQPDGRQEAQAAREAVDGEAG
jgi:N-methylhydantoinase B